MFQLRTMDVGMTPPIEYQPATAEETYTTGEALVRADGAVTKCTGAVKPQYVCVGAAEDGTVPCIRVQNYMIFETTLGVEGASLKAGDKVTIHTDGESISATTESGVAEIVYLAGTAAGDRADVRF